MTIVSDDPHWWPIIEININASYVAVACFAVVVYDWALAFEQEIELVWGQRCKWSFMNVIYFSLRYAGILSTLLNILESMPSISMTDTACAIALQGQGWIGVVAYAMLGVVMIARLYAMYHGSRKMLIFLVVIFLAAVIPSGVIEGVQPPSGSVELVLSGNHMCAYDGSHPLLGNVTWILGTVWEVLALFLAGWIAVKHFRELRRTSTDWASNFYAILLKTHLLYFVSFAVVACLDLASMAPSLSDSISLGSDVYSAMLMIAQVLQPFVLGPRLILDVREYNAKLVADSDEGTAMTSIAFQERVHISADSGV